ncbi:hypothetical protein F5B18DRAFT_627902 [Nemania serpens]|nr:hypothetical protein F5B18DRAFT_627902 [Nemania serpens]
MTIWARLLTNPASIKQSFSVHFTQQHQHTHSPQSRNSPRSPNCHGLRPAVTHPHHIRSVARPPAMYRAALRSTPRIASPLRQSCVRPSARRFASTVPADKGRGWKSSAVRWALAVGAVYWYSTSTAFAEEPKLKTIQPPPAFSDEDLPTVEAVIARKRQEAEVRSRTAAGAAESKTIPEPETAALATQTSPSAPAKEIAADGQSPPETGGAGALEEEASQQGAFNPETGEINWDCPCLGGMAHGPCGDEFRAAFSCFVYSTEEPKGMDCIDKFQHMQDCFRLHPEVYGDELADDEEAPAADDGVAAEGTLARDNSAKGAAGTESSAPEPTKSATPAQEVAETGPRPGEANLEGDKAAPTSSTPATRTSGSNTSTAE